MTEYNRLADQYKQERMTLIDERIKKLVKEKHKLGETKLYELLCNDNNNGNSLTDSYDQIKIIDNMKKDFPESAYFRHTEKKLGSLFWHVDNIRYVYNKEGLECPEWFFKKYGHLFNQAKTITD